MKNNCFGIYNLVVSTNSPQQFECASAGNVFPNIKVLRGGNFKNGLFHESSFFMNRTKSLWWE